MKIPGFMKIIIIQFPSWTENSVGVLLIQTICSKLESQKRELLLKINSIMKLRAHFPHNFNIWIPLQLFSPQIKKWLNGSICVLLRILHSSCSCSTLLNGKKKSWFYLLRTSKPSNRITPHDFSVCVWRKAPEKNPNKFFFRYQARATLDQVVVA